MPDSPTPFDDPFADLFGRLPDPRERRSAGSDAGRGVSGPSDAPAAAPGAPASAPLSRRAARAAAAGQAAAPQDTADRTAPDTALPSAPDREPVDRAVSDRGASDAAPARTAAPARAAAVTAAPRPVAGATLEDLFTGEQTIESLGSVPPPPDKRRRRIGGWIALGVVLILLGGITAGGFYVWTTYEDQIRALMGWEEPKDYEAGLANGEAFVTVSSGDTGAPISQSLFDAGVTKTPEAFYDFLIDSGQNPPFVPGVFKLQKQMTSEAALAALLDPANKMENSAQLREGLTLEQSLPLLADGTGIPLEDFQAAVADPTAYGVPVDPAVAAAGGQPLEGWLFPATYTFDPGVTATDVIATLVNRTIASLDAAGVPEGDRQRVLTVASIIQREARSEKDMQQVSRVIQNRLDAANQETFGLLQMDSTAQYGFNEDDGSVSTSAEAQYDDNPWNTYVRAGLPVGPIANPGDVAIDAAMNPPDGDWLYFVTVNLDTGETVFTSNIDDHNRAVAQWQAWCTENPDSGC